MLKRPAQILLALWSLVVLIAPVHAQTGKIAGQVTDAASGDPLPGANVVVQGILLGTSTDADGNYFILNVPPGTHAVRASMVGFTTLTKTEVRVFIDQTTPLDFVLSEEVVQGEEIVVIAERPPVEVDLTGSKQRLSGDELDVSWAKTVSDALLTQSGTNIHGGIRGGFGVEDKYMIDGLSLRDNVSGGNFSGVNTTAIGELEVLTGGWNAEYGQAMGSVINIVTKSATDRIHGSIRSRLRPPGKYHWGRNIYSQDNYEWREMATLQYWTENDGGGAWADRTPQERLDAWNSFITGEMFGDRAVQMQDYAERTTWETEATIYGPITSNLGFLLSGRYGREAPNFPSYLQYTKDWNYQAKLDFRLSRQIRIELSGMIQGFDNTEEPRLNYWSSEDAFVQGFWGPPPYYYSGYSQYKYWPFGTSHIFQLPSAPEFMRMQSGQFKLTHLFSESSFLEASASYTNMKLDRNNWEQLRESEFFVADTVLFGTQWNETMLPGNPLFLLPPIFHRRHPGLFNLNVRSKAAIFRLDYTNQITNEIQAKTGVLFSPQYVSKSFRSGDVGGIYSNYAVDPDFHPWDAAAYVQGKVEVKGMVINAGLRFDAFNANTRVAPSIFDPADLDENGLVTFDPGVNGVDTETQMVFSPRFGISHPITEYTVLHFSYGHFNQRPAWQLIGAGPTVFHLAPTDEGFPDPALEEFPGFYLTNTNTANPSLSFEKIIQYEIGFDQHIPNFANLDLTVFYKDGKNLTSLGVSKGRNDFIGFGSVGNLFGLGGSVNAQVHSDLESPDGLRPGYGIGRVTINGGYVDVRGLEASVETLFLRNASLQLIYNYSLLTSGMYGYAQLYRPTEDGTPARPNQFHGVSLTDRGISGTRNDRWNPSHSFKLVANLFTPERFGPSAGFLYPLGNWHLNAYYSYASGHTYTYHSPGDFSTEPNNMRWKPFHNTNLRLSKGINILGQTELELSIDVLNVFNNKRLRFPATQEALVAYHEEDRLPVNATTGEDSVWDWYDLVQLPRQVFFSVQLNF